VAGHIPGAINIPLPNLNQTVLPPVELRQNIKKFWSNKMENIIIHCGSGVTACQTLLAIDYAGLAMPKLFVGSWSEWSETIKRLLQNYKTGSRH
jgi:thiosulfate/3-mercaptopyruvate sulfurtransferase